MEALPRDLIEADAAADAAAASYLVGCLLALAVDRPEQAMEILLETVS